MADSLYMKYRPKTLADVIGQPDAVSVVRGFLKNGGIPKAVLLHGHSGTGKTTLARIMARELGCPPENRLDYTETNCGLVEPMAYVRELQAGSTASPVSAPVRVSVLDEVQSFSRAGFAAQGMLKILEDGPPHAHYFLCTTDPKKILPAIRGRCKQIAVNPIADADLKKLVLRVAAAEKVSPPLSDDVANLVVQSAGGSARNALEELEKVVGIPDEDERRRVVGAAGRGEKGAFDLGCAVIPFRGLSDWKKAVEVLEAIKDEEPEGIRQFLLAFARSALLKAGNAERGRMGYKVISCLDKPFYDKNSGHAQLAAAVFEICFAKG